MNLIENINEVLENMHMLGVNIRNAFAASLSKLNVDLTYEMAGILVLLSRHKGL